MLPAQGVKVLGGARARWARGGIYRLLRIMALLAVGALLPVAALFVTEVVTRGERRQVQPESVLMAERARHRELDAQHTASVLQHMVDAVGRRSPSDPNKTVDVLVLSGGGDRGAFGAGLLVGWGSVKDPVMARPDFEVVTGVSTGGFIAPFAFLGSDTDYQRINMLYRGFHALAPTPSGTLFFLPGRRARGAQVGRHHTDAQDPVGLRWPAWGLSLADHRRRALRGWHTHREHRVRWQHEAQGHLWISLPRDIS